MDTERYNDRAASEPAAGMTTAPDADVQNTAIAVFVLGLCSVISLFVIPVISWIVGLVCGIVALVMAGRIRRSTRLTGLGQAGFILAIIGTALAGLLVLLIIIALIVGLAAASSIASGAIGSALGPWSNVAWFLF